MANERRSLRMRIPNDIDVFVRPRVLTLPDSVSFGCGLLAVVLPPFILSAIPAVIGLVAELQRLRSEPISPFKLSTIILCTTGLLMNVVVVTSFLVTT